MNRRIKKYLYDINVAIDSINEYLGNHPSLEEYQKNKLLRRAIEREIEIIGEATNKVLNLNPEIHIKNARQIVSTRNFIIHSYDKIDNTLIWGIVLNYLPELKEDIVRLLNAKSQIST
jgi:uncharacterized protein with HEPN domain